jgi:hypothetical protein
MGKRAGGNEAGVSREEVTRQIKQDRRNKKHDKNDLMTIKNAFRRPLAAYAYIPPTSGFLCAAAAHRCGAARSKQPNSSSISLPCARSVPGTQQAAAPARAIVLGITGDEVRATATAVPSLPSAIAGVRAIVFVAGNTVGVVAAASTAFAAVPLMSRLVEGASRHQAPPTSTTPPLARPLPPLP